MELDVKLRLEWKSTALRRGGGDFSSECTREPMGTQKNTQRCRTSSEAVSLVFLMRSKD